ncbi:uncharacterized protein SOCG_04776 [Schizosaccharomyces octosporus yFS286]|uniref:Intimal thickness related receptor IRP domain-containing protein n=1 Tax=Schizosaccharomyces octosporus (strain yFS286) TaxID=483514 RepID=S9R8L5_SCHOY|nr:uncharacterized protein SOCG_04776 [Schizosaccharomyces octosporus yFS286]EPX70429.1 hypothetical protein SOCG_04776 [Schizosaccharomyces octosporus yFS286]
MGFISCKNWLLWLISVYCILQLSSAYFPYYPDFRENRIRISCGYVEVESNNTKAYFHYSTHGDDKPAASTVFNVKDEECALGSLGGMKSLFAFPSELALGRLSAVFYIPQEKRDEWTGPFNCNKTSVANNIIPFNGTYKEDNLKINESGTYCYAVRPLTSLGSAIDSWVYYYDYDYDYVDFLANESTLMLILRSAPLIFTGLLFFVACIWIYLLLSQPAKILPIQYGLLVYIIAKAIGITVEDHDEDLYSGISYPIELSIHCLLLFLGSFGIGVWRPVQFVQYKFLFMAIGGFSILVFLNILSSLTDIFSIHIEQLSLWLITSVSNAFWLSSILVFYKEWKQLNTKSESSAKVCKRSLVYCIAVFALQPRIILTPFLGESLSARIIEFLLKLLLYIIEIIIPCCIWFPSQNEKLAYTSSLKI